MGRAKSVSVGIYDSKADQTMTYLENGSANDSFCTKCTTVTSKASLTLSTNVENQDPYPTTVSNRILAHPPLTIGHTKTTSRAYTLPTPSTNSVYGNGIVPLPFTTPIVTLAMMTSSTILNSSQCIAQSPTTRS
jgi:hypothetical protein